MAERASSLSDIHNPALSLRGRAKVRRPQGLYVGHGIKLTGCKFLYVPS
jgi:hypothetical protein